MRRAAVMRGLADQIGGRAVESVNCLPAHRRGAAVHANCSACGGVCGLDSSQATLHLYTLHIAEAREG
jgi:hypothetical protein